MTNKIVLKAIIYMLICISNHHVLANEKGVYLPKVVVNDKITMGLDAALTLKRYAKAKGLRLEVEYEEGFTGDYTHAKSFNFYTSDKNTNISAPIIDQIWNMKQSVSTSDVVVVKNWPCEDETSGNNMMILLSGDVVEDILLCKKYDNN